MAPQLQFSMDDGMELPTVMNLREGRFVINPKVPTSLYHLFERSDLPSGKQRERERFWKPRSSHQLACGLVPLACLRLVQPEVQQSSLGNGSTLCACELGHGVGPQRDRPSGGDLSRRLRVRQHHHPCCERDRGHHGPIISSEDPQAQGGHVLR